MSYRLGQRAGDPQCTPPYGHGQNPKVCSANVCVAEEPSPLTSGYRNHFVADRQFDACTRGAVETGRRVGREIDLALGIDALWQHRRATELARRCPEVCEVVNRSRSQLRGGCLQRIVDSGQQLFPNDEIDHERRSHDR